MEKCIGRVEENIPETQNIKVRLDQNNRTLVKKFDQVRILDSKTGEEFVGEVIDLPSKRIPIEINDSQLNKGKESFFEKGEYYAVIKSTQIAKEGKLAYRTASATLESKVYLEQNPNKYLSGVETSLFPVEREDQSIIFDKDQMFLNTYILAPTRGGKTFLAKELLSILLKEHPDAKFVVIKSKNAEKAFDYLPQISGKDIQIPQDILAESILEELQTYDLLSKIEHVKVKRLLEGLIFERRKNKKPLTSSLLQDFETEINALGNSKGLKSSFQDLLSQIHTFGSNIDWSEYQGDLFPDRIWQTIEKEKRIQICLDNFEEDEQSRILLPILECLKKKHKEAKDKKMDLVLYLDDCPAFTRSKNERFLRTMSFILSKGNQLGLCLWASGQGFAGETMGSSSDLRRNYINIFVSNADGNDLNALDIMDKNLRETIKGLGQGQWVCISGHITKYKNKPFTFKIHPKKENVKVFEA